MNRIIIHSDLNSFFASVECLKQPWLKTVPMAVAGDTEQRHGIILAKNQLAASFGVQTAEPIWAAKQKCPSLVTVPPNHDDYVVISRKVRKIYEEYSNYIEPFGIDECWIDISDISQTYEDGKIFADEIRCKIKEQIGITASCGVSFNKVFAKLASDLRKPDATCVITPDNFKSVAWPLPVGSLLYVGRSTVKTFSAMNIKTIGDLANSDVKNLEMVLGKNGYSLWQNANGNDTSSVANINVPNAVKSVGNSITLPHDIQSDEDVRAVLFSLCEKVSSRLRKLDLICGGIQIFVRDFELNSYERQAQFDVPNRTVMCMFSSAFGLFKAHHVSNKPIRALGVRAINLSRTDEVQLTISETGESYEKNEQLDNTADEIRKQFGSSAIKRGIMLTQNVLSGVELTDDKTSLNK